jgi:hypothetical protein
MPKGSQEDIKSADEVFNSYVSALGRVAHSWNTLQEALGELFWTVTEMDKATAFAVWYSTPNDRAQRGMLSAAIDAKMPDPFNTAEKPPKKRVIFCGC